MKKEIIRCERCGDPLKKIVWLELSITDGKYYAPEHFPNDHDSQGLFSFGPDCAKTELKQTYEYKIKST